MAWGGLPTRSLRKHMALKPGRGLV